MSITSDLSGAQQKATEIKSAVSVLSSTSTINNDSRTTVAGNANAQEVIERVQGTTQKIMEAINSASSNLQSVAEEFAAVDKKGSDIFSDLFDEVK